MRQNSILEDRLKLEAPSGNEKLSINPSEKPKGNFFKTATRLADSQGGHNLIEDLKKM